MKTFFQESTDVLRRAIKQEIIDPTMRSIERKSYGKISLFQPLMKQLHEQVKRYRISTAWLGKQNTWLMPETRRYLTSVSPVVTPSVLSVSSPWLVELARFSVPENQFGIVKSFEQFLSLPGNPPTLYSGIQAWGNPFSMGANHVSWCFRLSPLADTQTTFSNITGLGAIVDHLPGRPYTDLPQTDDIWYPAGSPASANVHLPVPGGFCLRVFLLTPAIAGLNAAAKLAGTIQSELSSESQKVARVVW